MEISSRLIGFDHMPYVIAEVSANHNQSYSAAEEIVHAAAEAGADAVKLQTYTADTITIKSDRECFCIHGTIWDRRTLHDLYSEAYTPWDWQPKLKELAESLGMHCFSSPFDVTAVNFLEEMNVPAYKIASFEMVDMILIEKIAATGKPVIMSTGMALQEEIDEAIAVLQSSGAGDIALLKCTSAYPAPMSEMNLAAIPYLAGRYEVPVGLSDHTMGSLMPVAAVSLGASIIEKHLTLRRSDGGPDSSFSMQPDEFQQMVRDVRAVKKALGKPLLGPTEKEQPSLALRRSLFVVAPIKAGEAFTKENIRSIRPANGLHTRYYREILGKRASHDVERGMPLSWDVIEG